MYRKLLFTALCVHTISSAPQDNRNAEITYFKIEPIAKSNNEADINNKESLDNVTKAVNISKEDTSPKITVEILSELENVKKTAGQSADIENLNEAETNINTNETNNNYSSIDPVNNTITRNIDNIPSELKYQREAKDFEDLTTSSYETDNYSTDKSGELSEEKSVKSKLNSYKNFNSVTRNFIESSSKRRFRSRCRCEKIWNCPKLQITVPRCPDEEFMCCF